jgi:hypothetical protein
MGLFRSPGKVYKPAAEVDLGPGSDEHYISPIVRGQSCVLTIQFRLQSLFGIQSNPGLGGGDPIHPYASADATLFFRSHTCTAPRVAGLLVKFQAWVLETPVLGWIVLTVLKRDNLVYKVACSNFLPC